MEFVAIDVETANADLSSICQIGLAHYRDGALADEWKSFVDPEDFFDPINVYIHGIDESMVRGSPTIVGLVQELCSHMDGRVCVCHTHFDRVALRQAFEMHERQPPSCTWLDSARVARRAWKQFAWSGYGLGNVCAFLGYEFVAHDALEDAKAAANVLLAAIGQTGLGLEEWLKRVDQPIDLAKSRCQVSVEREGNPEGHLHGEVIVFTGRLSIPRHVAADMAASMGCQVDCRVTKETTILVVGDQDIKLLAGHEKSSKHRKAETLIGKGQRIRIIRESDFSQLAAVTE